MSAPSSTTLPVSWASLPALAALLDPDRLTELFGAALGGPLRTGALRYKPGVSAVARETAALSSSAKAGGSSASRRTRPRSSSRPR